MCTGERKLFFGVGRAVVPPRTVCRATLPRPGQWSVCALVAAVFASAYTEPAVAGAPPPQVSRMLSEQVWEPLPYQPCDLPQVIAHSVGQVLLLLPPTTNTTNNL